VCLPAGCNDGFRRGDEQCDGTALGSASDCMDLGYYYSAPLTCNSACSYVTSECTGTCGDGNVDAPFELCDGAPPAISCSDLGYGAGFLDCNNCGPGVEACHLFGWDPSGVTTAAQFMNDVHGSSDSRVFAAGDNGAVYHYDGANWSAVDISSCGVGATFAAKSVWTFASSVLVGGENGTVLTITDGGCTASTGAVGASAVTDLWALSETDVYAVTDTGVYHFEGGSWSVSSATTGLTRLWGSGTDDIYAVGNGDPITPSATIIHKDASGWSPVSLVGLASIGAVWGSGPDDVYVGGWSGTTEPTTARMRHWDGNSWSAISAPMQKVTAGAVAGNRLFVAGQLSAVDPADPGIAGVMELDGASWTDLQWPTTTDRASSVWRSASGALFGTSQGRARIYRFPGSTRIDTSLTALYELPRLSVRTSNDALAVRTGDDSTDANDFGRIRHWNGTAWPADNPPGLTAKIIDASLTPNGTAYALETGVALWRKPPAGTWTQETTLAAAKTADRVWAAGVDDVWLFKSAGGNSTMSHWIGTGFASCSSCAFSGDVRDIAGSSASNIYAVGGSALIAHYDGMSWEQIPSPAPVTDVPAWAAVGVCGDDVFLGAAFGWIAHYDGSTWSVTSLPSPLDVRSIWCTGPDDVFAGTTSGYLYWFDGAHWSTVKSGTSLTVQTGAVVGDTTFWTDQEGVVHRLVRTITW
jgi:hypothetical protein